MPIIFGTKGVIKDPRQKPGSVSETKTSSGKIEGVGFLQKGP